MKKTIFTVVVLFLLVAGGYYVGTNLGETNKMESVTTSTENTVILTQPERKAEIYGKIKSIVGNEIVVTKSDPSVDPTINMEPAEKQAYMQSLDEAERTKLKEEILNATLGDVKILVPIGIPMNKKTEQGAEGQTLEASLADLKVGGIVSVWIDNTEAERTIAEFVKISNTK